MKRYGLTIRRKPDGSGRQGKMQGKASAMRQVMRQYIAAMLEQHRRHGFEGDRGGPVRLTSFHPLAFSENANGVVQTS